MRGKSVCRGGFRRVLTALSSNRPRRRQRTRRLEALDPRQLLAGSSLVISEFLASNGKGLADEDGEFSDWIEVQNVDHAPLSLEGYHLTDSAGEPAKWTFPDVTLGPGEYLVVFASGKDRAADAGPLHTNFRLSDEGEYLGLVAPDGTTVLQQFSPAFPRQRTGISYGAPQSAQATELVTGASAASILTPGDGQLGPTGRNSGSTRRRGRQAWPPSATIRPKRTAP